MFVYKKLYMDKQGSVKIYNSNKDMLHGPGYR
jgi:hypothetical protein